MDVRRAEAGTVRELLRVAVPLALSTGTLSVMHVTDRVFLTWHDQNALAASLPAATMAFRLGVPKTLLSIFAAAVVTAEHGPNIKRLIAGTEPDFSLGKMKNIPIIGKKLNFGGDK